MAPALDLLIIPDQLVDPSPGQIGDRVILPSPSPTWPGGLGSGGSWISLLPCENITN